jgi:hypothetical protein
VNRVDDGPQRLELSRGNSGGDLGIDAGRVGLQAIRQPRTPASSSSR